MPFVSFVSLPNDLQCGHHIACPEIRKSLFHVCPFYHPRSSPRSTELRGHPGRSLRGAQHRGTLNISFISGFLSMSSVMTWSAPRAFSLSTSFGRSGLGAEIRRHEAASSVSPSPSSHWDGSEDEAGQSRGWEAPSQDHGMAEVGRDLWVPCSHPCSSRTTPGRVPCTTSRRFLEISKEEMLLWVTCARVLAPTQHRRACDVQREPPVSQFVPSTHLSLTTLMVLMPVALAIWMTAWPTPLLAAFWMTESPGEQNFGAAVTAGAAIPYERGAGGP